MKPFTHAIFDFDGVVADTESVFALFDCDLLNEVLHAANINASLTPKDVRALAGNNDKTKLDIIARRFGFEGRAHEETFVTKRTHLRKTLFADHTVRYGHGVIDFVTAHKDKCALATNKIASKLHHDLELMGIESLFDTIISCDPPMRKKPAPDMLIAAAKHLNATPENCIYVGDNTLDMQAAIAANMAPVGFVIDGVENTPDHANSLKNAGAVFIIDDFSALSPYFEAL